VFKAEKYESEEQAVRVQTTVLKVEYFQLKNINIKNDEITKFKIKDIDIQGEKEIVKSEVATNLNLQSQKKLDFETVALKLYLGNNLETFKKEISIGENPDLKSRYLLRYIESFKFENYYIAVMEYYEDGDLYNYIFNTRKAGSKFTQKV
jgi:serine/threonine protein kinase